MGQIANQMLMEAIPKIQQKLRNKKTIIKWISGIIIALLVVLR